MDIGKLFIKSYALWLPFHALLVVAAPILHCRPGHERMEFLKSIYQARLQVGTWRHGCQPTSCQFVGTMDYLVLGRKVASFLMMEKRYHLVEGMHQELWLGDNQMRPGISRSQLL